MTRDEIRAKGAKDGKMTNFEKYFGTPKKLTKLLYNSDKDAISDKYCKELIECEDYETITEEKCGGCILDWLNQEEE